MKKLHFVALALLLMACAEKKTITPTPQGLSLRVKNYLLEVVDIMKNFSVNKQSIDWDVFTNDVIKEAGNALTIEAAQPAIKKALTMLKDNHSFIQTSSSSFIFAESSQKAPLNTDVIGLIPDNIGYIKVQGNFQSKQTQSEIAQAIQDEIKKVDKENLEGWIVDLRGNDGGNIWPMIAGLGPILGDGSLGYFINGEGTESPWSYSEGKAQLSGLAYASISNPYVLKKRNPKVAVLINRSVASAGELVAIAFKGRNNTKFFGSATFGQSTSNQRFSLTDESALYLLTSLVADRNKIKYGKQLEPDTQTATAESTNKSAIDWLNEK